MPSGQHYWRVASFPTRGGIILRGRAGSPYWLALARFVARGGMAWARHATAAEERKGAVWREVPQLLEELGPAFVKMGQLASTRRDVLSEEGCTALAALREDASLLDGDFVEQVLSKVDVAKGGGYWQSIGRGSIAGVFMVESEGGVAAAKILRPGIAERLEADCRVVRQIAWLANRVPPFHRLPLVDMISFLAASAEMQVDLRREGDNLQRLAATLAHLPIDVPAVYGCRERGDVLVMEYLPAFADRYEPPDGSQAAARLLEAVFTMIFRSGFVHLDLHGGNYAWTRENRLQIIDAGFSVQLSSGTRRQFSEFFIGLSFGNGARAADSIIASAIDVPPKFDRKAFTDEVGELILSHRRLPAKEFRIAPFTYSLFDIQRRHRLFVRSEFIAPVLALLAVEGQVREWAPELDFQVIAQAIILGSIAMIPAADS